MALDGFVVRNIVKELDETITGGKIDKIYQPESDEVVFHIRAHNKNIKLLLTANAAHPRVHLTQTNKINPQTAPMFCMVLRKHLTNGRIVSVQQEDFERIINMYVESMNEMGDLSVKKVVVEIMGKHSNVIVTDAHNLILDSIKHISLDKSSVREVLPGKQYVLPPSQNKKNPLYVNFEDFEKTIRLKNIKLQHAIYQSYSGISPISASEILERAGIDPSDYVSELKDAAPLYESFRSIMEQVANGRFTPYIFSHQNKIVDFASIDMVVYKQYVRKEFESISTLLEFYYGQKDRTYRIQQKSQDLRKLISINIERCVKKKDIQKKMYLSTQDMDTWRLFGELITASIYAIQKGDRSLITQNFYDENNAEIKIPLDENLTPAENAQKYFNQYSKAKRRLKALREQEKQTDEELFYLQGVLGSLENAIEEEDIKDVRDELFESGFVKKKNSNKNNQKIKQSKPLQFTSKEGFDIFVGKNNKQNDYLTLQFAASDDIWLHTKNFPGSHVIIKSHGAPVSDETLTYAAMLAAYYSKARDSSSVPVDYTLRKYVRKVNGAKPGMVIYEKNKTVYVTPDKDLICSPITAI